MYLIPKKLIAGFNKRNNSLDGKLAFLSYYNNKNDVVGQNKIERWRDTSIPMEEFSNEIQSGFVMGDSVQRSINFGSGGDVYIRIYSPQGFEIEISLANFMDLAMYASIEKKYIIAKCVFSWDNKGKLYLLSTESPEYQASLEYSKNYFSEFNKISSFDDLQFGDIINKNVPSNVLKPPFIYLGKHYLLDSTHNEKALNSPSNLYFNKETEKAFFKIGKIKEDNVFIETMFPINSCDQIYLKSYFRTLNFDKKSTYEKVNPDTFSILINTVSHVEKINIEQFKELNPKYSFDEKIKTLQEVTNIFKSGLKFLNISTLDFYNKYIEPNKTTPYLGFLKNVLKKKAYHAVLFSDGSLYELQNAHSCADPASIVLTNLKYLEKRHQFINEKTYLLSDLIEKNIHPMGVYLPSENPKTRYFEIPHFHHHDYDKFNIK